ncbi:hypothetical protein [Chelatococcus asaccharovorans]|uniref:hypothetical protein n=1 Tax=Chelatococcus asaccharovorans TaxID=28210 RepID=UPI00224C69DA|nr:hypothetical protein [Chelatococcus asaccharovorans]CAH1649757.1 hypothetical protein CHELA40_10269 [Chelatococcus asaccharovorans]CAH1686906.1 hypothetical protein CHELA17_65341 [Chelatococcus asaccharovorans]
MSRKVEELNALIAAEVAEASPMAPPMHVLAVAALGDCERFRTEATFDLGVNSANRAPMVIAAAEQRLREMPRRDTILRAVLALESALAPENVASPQKTRNLLEFALDTLPSVSKSRRDALGAVLVSEARVSEPILVDALRSIVITMRTAPVAADILDAISGAVHRAERALALASTLDDLREDAAWTLDLYGGMAEWKTLEALGDFCASLHPLGSD